MIYKKIWKKESLLFLDKNQGYKRKNINKTFRELRRRYYEGERKLGQYYKRRNFEYD